MSHLALLASLDSSSDDDSDVEFDALIASTQFKMRPIWVENHIKFRRTRGEFHLYEDLSDKKFQIYFRKSRETFLELHDLIKADIKKQNTNMRESISTEQRLAVCLRYLSTGDSFRSIAFSYRMGESTVSKIVEEVCDALWKHLQPKVLQEPTRYEWKQIAAAFKKDCQFDHCCGAIDGKHVTIECPPNSGSTYFNYKKTFSIVLLAVADSRRKFAVVDIGSVGRFSDSGILNDSEFGKKLKSGNLPLPEEEPLILRGLDMPYVFVGDEAFPLMKNLMRPYPTDRLNESRKNFNYRLSRARRVVENAFGILAARWRIYRRPIECKVELADKIVKATVVLHNFLIEKSNIHYFNHGRDANLVVEEENQLLPLRHRGFHHSDDSFMIREEFCHYFNTIGTIPWQSNRIQRRLFTTRR